MSGAEVVAAISLISSIANLLDFGARVVHRLNEFRDNVRDLPETFRHIGAQLPLLLETADWLQAQAHAGTLSGGAREALMPVVEGLREQVGKLDRTLLGILPAEGAKRSEKAVKAVKSLAVERDVEELSSLVQSYVFALTVYQTTCNGDLIGLLFDKVVVGGSLVSAVPGAKKSIFMVGYERDENFIGRNDIMADVKERFKRMRRVQRDFKTCAALQKDVLARTQQVLGVEHPISLIEMGSLTYSLIKLDQCEAAEQLAVEALSLRIQVFGNGSSMEDKSWISLDKWTLMPRHLTAWNQSQATCSTSLSLTCIPALLYVPAPIPLQMVRYAGTTRRFEVYIFDMVDPGKLFLSECIDAEQKHFDNCASGVKQGWKTFSLELYEGGHVDPMRCPTNE